MLARCLFLFCILIPLLSACGSYADTSVAKVKNELIVLSHGLGRSGSAMWRLQDKFEDAGYQVCVIDYQTLGKTVDQVMTQSHTQINECIKDAPKVHFVGHSLGGLVIRNYLTQTNNAFDKAKLGEVVLVGTPNKGSEVADHMKNNILMKSFGGGISHALVTGKQSLGNQLPEFNFPVGVIAGTSSSKLTNRFFKGANDGLVSVESAKVSKMKDFVTLDVSHSAMRYSSDVASQIIHFLEQGSFYKEPIAENLKSA